MLPIEAPQLVNGSFYIYVVRTVCLNKKVHLYSYSFKYLPKPCRRHCHCSTGRENHQRFQRIIYKSFSALRVDGDGTDISVTQRCQHVSDPFDNCDSSF